MSQAEVDDPALSRRIHHQVGGLDVAMQDIEAVNVMAGLGGFQHDLRNGPKIFARKPNLLCRRDRSWARWCPLACLFGVGARECRLPNSGCQLRQAWGPRVG